MDAATEESDMTYSKELRAATKDVHKLSDVLVNAKFALALSDDEVWADGLLAFYEIYKFLEERLPEELLPAELHRTASFERDLEFFLGEDWKKSYEPRTSVKQYLTHLQAVGERNNLLLFAYAFQMYMALMSGGQLLQKKRMIARKLWLKKADEPEEWEEEELEKRKTQQEDGKEDDLQARPMPLQVTICPAGCAATYFPQEIRSLKAKLRNILNSHYKDFNDQQKAEFIEESRNVFIYNGEVVRSIKGVNKANLKKLGVVLVFVMSIYFALKFTRT